MTGPRVSFVMHEAFFEIYTWILIGQSLYLYLSNLSRFGYEISDFKYTTGQYSEQPPEQPAHMSRLSLIGKMDSVIHTSMRNKQVEFNP